MGRRISLIIAIVIFVALLGACQPKRVKTAFDQQLIDQSYAAADSLAESIQKREPGAAPVLLTDFVSLSGMSRGTSLGRIISKQVGSRMAELGVTVIDLKQREYPTLVREGVGEFGLSREVRELAESVQANSILAGAIAVAEERVYVNARVLRGADNAIVAGYDFELDYDEDVRAMLKYGDMRGRSGAGALQPTVETDFR
jgi:TolB-like protein